MSLLVIAEETFDLSDGALQLASAVPSDVVDRAHLKQGDQLELRRPDGTVITPKLHCFDFLVPSHERIGLGLSKPLTKAAIPVGTEVWKVT